MAIFLTFLVLIANLLVHLFEVPHYYHAVSHAYYGTMILAVIYASQRGQRGLLALTTMANLVYVARYPTEMASILVLFLYPVLVLGMMHVIRQLRTEQGIRGEQLTEINSANAYLEKRVRDLSTLFEVSQTANANLELEELFQQIIEILSNRLGIYRGALHLYQDGKVTASAEVVLGLTPAEMKRGTDGQMEDIQKRVLASGKAIGVPQTRLPRSYVKLFEPENVASKDAIAFWCIPVIVEEHVVGTLTIDKASDEFSADDDRRLLTIIASIIAQRVKIQQTIDALVESERLATLGRLVRTIAHEVRNPLSSIRLGTQLLQHTAARPPTSAAPGSVARGPVPRDAAAAPGSVARGPVPHDAAAAPGSVARGPVPRDAAAAPGSVARGPVPHDAAAAPGSVARGPVPRDAAAAPGSVARGPVPRDAADSQEEVHEWTEIIIKEVDRLNRFIEQLLAFSKPAMEFAKRSDIHELLEASLSICRAELERQSIHVVTEYGDTPYPEINVNPEGITQVLLNLFYNAREAMQTGGTLKIQTEYRQAEETVLLRIQDTGPGIAPDEVQHLFHPFYTTKQKGTGLGLYISRKILEEHDGSIDVDASLAIGTAFDITLPCLQRTEQKNETGLNPRKPEP